MARVCEICNKGVLSGNKVSHANNKTKKRSYPNLKKVKVVTEKGETKHIRVCTRCIKSGKVVKAA